MTTNETQQNNAAPPDTAPGLDARQFTVSDASGQELHTYRRELQASITASAERISGINRKMQRQQELLQAAMAIGQTKKDQLEAEQQKLNALEEQSRHALLQYMEAKQQIDSLMQDYNTQLEHVKQLRNEQDSDSIIITEQKHRIQTLLNEWQQQNFYLQKQQRLEQELNTNTPPSIDELPPLSDLQPPVPQPDPPAKSSSRAAIPHANAGFWENKKHTALDPEKLRQGDPAAVPTPRQETPRRRSLGRTLLSYTICIVLAVAAAFAIRTWIVVPTHVSGSSMLPTLQSDDKILTSPLPYIFAEPQRGDIIVFPAPDTAEEGSVYYVKRVIALPGEHLRINDGSVYINDTLLEEAYLADSYTGGYIDTLVPQGCIFVMGDNRQVSHDSRDANVSFIDIDNIRGKALCRFYPLEDIGSIY